MEDPVITTPSNSANPQADLLNQFFDKGTIPDAQAQAKASGGVAVEDAPIETKEVEQAPAPVQQQQTRREEPEQDDAPPSDILKQDVEPAALKTEEETIPREVAQRGKKGVDAWTAAKREAKQYKQQLEELQNKLKEFETNNASSKELNDLKARYEESEKNRVAMEEKLGQLDITHSSQFRDTYEKPINATFAKSVKLLVQAGVDQKAARDLVIKTMSPSNTPDAIQDIVQDYPTAIQGALYQNALEMIEGQKRRAAALQDWKATRAALKEEERRTTEVKAGEIISQNVDSAIDSIRTEGSWLYSKSDTNNEWNTKVQERINAVKGLMKTATPDVLAKYVADGIVSKTYRQLYERQLQIANKLKKELSAYGKVRPGLGGSGPAFEAAEDKSKPVKANDWLSANL